LSLYKILQNNAKFVFKNSKHSQYKPPTGIVFRLFVGIAMVNVLFNISETSFGSWFKFLQKCDRLFLYRHARSSTKKITNICF